MRKPVKIYEGAYERAKAYSEATGIPIVKVIDDAINDWMDTVGAARLESLSKPTTILANVVSISGEPDTIALRR